MYEKINKLFKESKLTNAELERAIGLPSKVIDKWNRGDNHSYRKYISDIALYFNVTTDYLLGRTDTPRAREDTFDVFSIPGVRPMPETRKIPLLGDIACGDPITAVENIDRYVDVESNIKCDFALTCRGDSMIGARILDGDIVFIQSQPMVENGEIAAVLIDGEATLKRVYYYPDKNKLVLNAENPQFEPLVYIGSELNEIRVLGRAAAFQSLVK